MKALLLFSLLCFIIESKFLERNLAELDLETIRNVILSRHNTYRKQHQVDDLVRNSAIEEIAQAYSETLAASTVFQHSLNKFNGFPLGENIYRNFGISVDGNDAVDTWYDQINMYDFKNQGFSTNTGHFTQLVWKGSKNLGCGIACGSACIVICNYFPPGNLFDEFESNVFPKK